MKKYILGTVIVATLFSACSKGGETTTTPPVVPPVTEAKITATLDIDKGDGSYYGALGSTQAINVAVTNLPKAGVQVDVVTTKELDGIVVSSSSVSRNFTPIPVTVDNLTPGVQCVVTIKVTSKSDSTNTVSPKMKIVRK
jgi:hypothetical protein